MGGRKRGKKWGKNTDTTMTTQLVFICKPQRTYFLNKANEDCESHPIRKFGTQRWGQTKNC